MIQCGRPTVTGIAGILAFLVTTIAPIAEAQLNCEMPPPAGIDPWPQGHTIVVYIHPSIPEPFKNAIKGAFQNWSDVGGSGVQFGGFYESADGASNPGDGAIGVRMAELPSDVAGGMDPVGGGGHLRSATIRINDKMTDERAVANIVSHEIGHTFNLHDCSACRRGASAMKVPWQHIDDVGAGKPRPARCDRLAVRAWNNYSGPDDGPPWRDPDAPDDDDRCYVCGIREICYGEDDIPYVCYEYGHCCDFGFLADPVQPEPGMCAYRNLYNASEEELCNERCDAQCVAKINCGDAACEPDHCWKCPNGPGPVATMHVPPGSGPTCQEMGWYPARLGAECQAAAGAPCVKKQICNGQPCQPWPNYCWKHPDAPPPPPSLPGYTCDVMGWYFEQNTCENACDAECIQKHICGPGPCQPGDCYKCPDPSHVAPGNQPPTAHPGGPYGANVGQGFQLYGTASSDPDGYISRYLWTFPDGSTAEGSIISRRYWSPGDDQVWLTVIDNKAKNHTAGTTISISRINYPPTVSVGGPDWCVVPCTASLSAAGSDPNGDSLIYTWYGCASGSGASASCDVAGPRPVVAAVMANDSWGGIAWGWKTVRASSGDTTIGVYRPGESQWYVRNTNGSGPADLVTAYGLPDDIPVSGDWNGDGVETIGTFRPSNHTWYLRYTDSVTGPDYLVDFGADGDKPVVGDWNGDGVDTVGVFRPSNSTWYLRNSNSAGEADIVVVFGGTEIFPLVGDWNGDGVDTIGIYRPATSRFHLMNTNTAPAEAADVVFVYGNLGDKPVCGDWNGDGIDTIGVFRPSEAFWYLRNSNSEGSPDVPAFGYGVGADRPVVGNWDGQ